MKHSNIILILSYVCGILAAHWTENQQLHGFNGMIAQGILVIPMIAICHIVLAIIDGIRWNPYK